MSHTRKPFQWDNYASSTAVSDDGCVGMRANVDGSGLEVSYDGAAWTAFSGAASSKWNGITNPDGNQALTMAAHTTTWTWNATTSTNDLVTLTNTTDDTGTGVLFHIKTPGASNTKTPFRVTTITDRVVEVNASGNLVISRFSASPGALFALQSGRGTLASPTAIQSGDTLASVQFGGQYNSSVGGTTASATIRAEASANFTATNDAPSDLLFSTKSNTSGVHIAVRVTSDRWVGIGEDIAHGDVLARLHVKTGTADLVGFRLDAPVSGTADIAAIYNQASTKVVYVSSTGTLFTTPTSGVAGINVGSLAGDPSSLGNGDIWYSTSANALRARVNGTTVSLSTSAPRLDEIANPAASKTFTMSAGGTDYPLIFSWDSTTGATNLFTLETAAGTGTGAMLLIKPLGGQEALVVNNGANQFVLGEGGEIDTNGLLTIRAASGLGIRLFDGATNNVYLQYVGATPALRVIFNGGPAESLVTEPGTQTLTNKTLSTATSVSVAIAWGDGVTQTFNPNGTSAGINVGAHTADPSALNNGDVWYNSTGNVLNARINGATVALGAGGGGSPGGSGSEIQYRSGASTFGAVTTSSVSGANVTWGGTHTQTLTNTSTSTTLEYLDQNITISPASASTAMHRLLSQTVTFGTAQTGGDVRMYYYSADHNQAAALTSFRGTEGTFSKSATGTVTAVYGDAFNGTASAGTITQIVGSNTNLSTNGGTITTGMGFYATADNASGTFTTYTAYRAFASGTITNLYGFASSAGFKHGFGTLTPTVTVEVVGDAKINNTITTMVNDTTYYGLDTIVTLTPGGAASGVIVHGISSRVDTTNTTASYNELIGLYSDVRLDQAVSGGVRGLRIEVLASGAATSSAVHGILMDCGVASNRTVTELYGMQWSLNGGITGTVTTAYGARWDIIPIGTTVGTYYGLYLDVDDPSAKITNTYAIVTTSDAGNSGFGTIAPTAMLHTVAPLTTSVAGIFQTAASSTADCLRLMASSTTKVKFTTNAAGDMNTVLGSAALSTTATDGFLFMPTCAGAATGTPSTYTGTAPVVIDTTNFRIYVNIPGTGWKMAQLA